MVEILPPVTSGDAVHLKIATVTLISFSLGFVGMLLAHHKGMSKLISGNC